MSENDVSLRVDGQDFAGWKSVRISAGIERIARDFELSITRKWPGTDIAQRVRPGMPCEVYIGSDKLVTGYIDATPIRYDGQSVSVAIKGRSKTGDLVDCCPVELVPAGGWQDVDNGKSGPRQRTQQAPGSWHRAKLEHIAAVLAKPYKVGVSTEIDTGPVLDFSINQGETVFEVFDRMMRMNHVLMTDTGAGDIVIIKPGSTGKCTTQLVLGGNVLSADAPLDFKNVYSEYVCKGQRATTDDESADKSSSSASISNTSIFGASRVRGLVIIQSGQSDEGNCQDRVNYEQSHRYGKALETVYTVAGWRQQDGSLWLPNKMVHVRDDLVGFDAEMLIIEVTYLLDKEGMKTSIKVGPQSGYLTKAAKKDASGWSDVKMK